MHPALKHFRSFLDALADLVDGVRGNIDINRPRFAAPGVGKRLRAGIRLIEVYLRRVLLVLALKLEPDLVHNPGALRDSKRSVLCERGPVFRVLLDQYLSRHDRAELREMARERRLGWGHDPRPAPGPSGCRGRRAASQTVAGTCQVSGLAARLCQMV